MDSNDNERTYVFWYSTEQVYKAWFTANSEEEAEELLDKLQKREISMDDLPDFENSIKEENFDVATDTLEEMGY